MGDTDTETDISSSESNLATDVDNAGVWVKERQKDATTGVQFLQSQRLSKVLLLEEIHIQRVIRLIISSV